MICGKSGTGRTTSKNPPRASNRLSGADLTRPIIHLQAQCVLTQLYNSR
jgi:hypothetical protein